MYISVGNIYDDKKPKRPENWICGSSQNKLPFICKSPAYPQLSEETKPVMCPYKGYEDFYQFNGSCYKFSTEGSVKTWQYAEAQCRSIGAHLTSVFGWMEQLYILQQLAKNGVNSAWLGITNKVNIKEKHGSCVSKYEFSFETREK